MRRMRANKFRDDAGRIALSSGPPRKQLASDLDVGMSPLYLSPPGHQILSPDPACGASLNGR